MQRKKGTSKGASEVSQEHLLKPSTVKNNTFQKKSKSSLKWKPFLYGVMIAYGLALYLSNPPKTVSINGVEKPSPPGSWRGLAFPFVPLLGETLEFQQSSFKFIERRVEAFGKIFASNALFLDAVALTGSQGMKIFYDKEYVTRNGTFPFPFYVPIDGHILNMFDGVTHDQRRAAIVKSMNPHSQLSFMLSNVESKIKKFKKIWTTQKTFQWNKELQNLMQEIASVNLLGVKNSDQNRTVDDFLKPLISATLGGLVGVPVPLPGFPWWEARSATIKAKYFYKQLMEDKKASNSQDKDMLSVMTRDFQKGVLDTKDGFAVEVHHAMMAHVSLVANMIAGMMMHLSLNPEIKAKLYQEVKNIPRNEPITLELLEKMKYLTYVVDESRRISPGSAAMLGTVVKSFEIDGYSIPEGKRVMGNFWGTNNDNDEWTNPEKFDPERFERGEPKGGHMAWVPHGRAHHECPGLNLTTVIMKTSAIHFLRDCDWKLSTAEKDLDWNWAEFNPQLKDYLQVDNFRCDKF